MPKKKTTGTTEIQPIEIGNAPATAKVLKPAAKTVRAPRASATPVTHKHKKSTHQEEAVRVETAPVAVAVPVHQPTHEEIGRLAYSYWEARGHQGGSQDEDWMRAEQVLRRR